MIRTIGKLACKTLGVGAVLTAGFAYGVYSCILALGEENERSQALLEKFKSIRKDYDLMKEEKKKKEQQELRDILNKLDIDTDKEPEKEDNQSEDIQKEDTQSPTEETKAKSGFIYEEWLTKHMS